MPQPPLSRHDASVAVALVQAAVNDGFSISGPPSAHCEAARRYNIDAKTKISDRAFAGRVRRAADLYGLRPKAPKASAHKPAANPATLSPDDLAALASKVRASLKTSPKTPAQLAAKFNVTGKIIDQVFAHLRESGVNLQKLGEAYDIPPAPPQSYLAEFGEPIELVSSDDDTFCFGAFGDLHAASKHTRWDVRADLVRAAEEYGAQCIFDTGNWIDGEARFNRYDLEVVGLEPQLRLLAKEHPRSALPIYAITGDDHEGWYAAREGINVGKNCEAVMRAAGHDWTDLGYMEAHVILRNANSGKTATLAVTHPGGGSAYALSYSTQKIVESYEGGEKPDVAIYGHYHKLWAGIIRNIWCVQTGCQQDQTPFMRKRRLEAHVGGAIVELRQDQKTGAIIEMTPRLRRYFNKGWYGAGNRWSHHGPIRQDPRAITAIRGRAHASRA